MIVNYLLIAWVVVFMAGGILSAVGLPDTARYGYSRIGDIGGWLLGLAILSMLLAVTYKAIEWLLTHPIS